MSSKEPKKTTNIAETTPNNTLNGETPASPQQQQPTGPEFGIREIFIKDISFETPDKIELPNPTQAWQPNVDVELNASTTQLAAHIYQVVLSITVTAKVEGKTAFLVEVKQLGTFGIKNFPDAQLNRMLGSYCPGVLFPYVRELISDIVIRGGFPPLYLAPINFDVLYEQQLQKQQAEKNATATSEVPQ